MTKNSLAFVTAFQILAKHFLPINVALGTSMDEAKLSKWILKITCGSYLIIGLFIMVVYVIFSFGKSITLSPFVYISLCIAALYAISLYLIYSLPNKGLIRRLLSWVYSAIFHFGLLIYMYLVSELGTFIFVLLMAETLIAVLVAIGLVKVIQKSIA